MSFRGFVTDTIWVAIEMHAFSPQPDCWIPLPAPDTKGPKKISPRDAGLVIDGGEGGIRTLDTLLTYTPLAGERLQPLGHFSVYVDQSLTTASVQNVGLWLQKWLQNSPHYEAHDRWISSRREDITPSSICDIT